MLDVKIVGDHAEVRVLGVMTRRDLILLKQANVTRQSNGVWKIANPETLDRFPVIKAALEDHRRQLPLFQDV